MSILRQSNASQAIQAMPLIQGQVNVTSGTFQDITVLYCVLDGDIIITWFDLTTTTVSCTEGDAFTLPGDHTDIEVSSGTFHLA